MPVGRRTELERLAGLLADDVPVVVVGEAGVGKTTVLRAAAAATGRRVLEGGALSTLSWLDYLALERAVGRSMRNGDPIAVAADVEEDVGDAVLLLDDLHWAAAATLEVAAALAGRVSLLAGVRSGEPGSDRALEQLQGAGFVPLPLTGLPADAAGELVSSLRPDLGPAARERLVRRTGGNPLLLHELVSTGEPSASLRLALAARLRRLDAPGRETFDLLALAGRPIAAEALGEAGVKSLLDADLVSTGPSGVTVRHTLLGELAVEQMPAEAQQALHARIAREVDDIGEAARHYALAGEPDNAFKAAMQAVARTSRPGEQASHLAVAAACASGPEADALRLRAARALEAAHDWNGMIAILAMLDDDNTEARAAACLMRARGAWTAGDVDELRAALAEGLRLAEGTGSEVEVRLRIEQSRVPLFVDVDIERGVSTARSAFELATATGVDIPRAEYLYGTALAVADDPRGSEHLEEAIRAARKVGDTSTEFLAANNLISVHESAGDPPYARRIAREYIERSRELGLGEWERTMRVALASLDFHMANYPNVIAEAEELLTQQLEPRGRDQLLEALCLTLIDVGRIDEALRRLDAVGAEMARDFRGGMQALWVRIEAAIWGGRPDQALPLCERYLSENPENDPNILFGWVSRAWARLDLGHDPGPSAPPQIRKMLLAVPLEVDGVRAMYAGKHETAAELLCSAARAWAPFHVRGEIRCLWGAGEALRRSGDLPAAVRQLEAVESRAKELGMLPILTRVHRSLRAAGRHRSAPRRRSAGSILTERQREILGLVAQGLTNAQIATRLGVSRHTVVTQLASASAKLGASSRAQAASMAAAVLDAP